METYTANIENLLAEAFCYPGSRATHLPGKRS